MDLDMGEECDIVIKVDTREAGLEISQNKICRGECRSSKFYLNKNTLLFSVDVIGSYFRPWGRKCGNKF